MKPKMFITMAAAGVAGLKAGRWVSALTRGFSFEDKVVLLTGGARGLGLVMARELVRHKAIVAFCGRQPEELVSAEEELTALGGIAQGFLCDVCSASAVAEMVSRVKARFGEIDVLINNAGTIQVGPLATMTPEDYQEAMNTHFWGPFHLLQAVLPDFRRRRSGRIVNISSIGGKVPTPHLLPYSASKFALTGFSEGLGAELARDGIVVTTVCPGLMRTGSPRNVKVKGDHEKEYAWFIIGDSLPGITVSAEKAARQILAACRRGDAELIIGWPYQVAARLHGLFPASSVKMLGWVNRILPNEPFEGGKENKLGKESESSLSRSFLTKLTRDAAKRNHETVGDDSRRSA